MPPDWAALISEELDAGQFLQLEKNVSAAYETFDELIQPAPENVFRALRETSVEQVKVVLLGQDPYHGPGQAHGLSFSVPKKHRKIPPSLQNIFKEIKNRFKHAANIID